MKPTDVGYGPSLPGVSAIKRSSLVHNQMREKKLMQIEEGRNILEASNHLQFAVKARKALVASPQRLVPAERGTG